MSLFEVVILSIVEGITEFLPISSTFHLLFTSKILGIEFTQFIQTFIIAIQGGAILAVLTLYGREVVQNLRLAGAVIASFVVTAIVGAVLYVLLSDDIFANQFLMIGVFMLVGMIFIAFEFWLKRRRIVLKKTVNQLTLKQAALVGLVQTIAVVPGVSRSGAVMLALMQLGFTRADAAKYSFLLAVPTILAASVFSLLDGFSSILVEPNGALILLTGAAVSYGAAYFSLRFLIRYLQTHSLVIFGVYRLVVGAGLLVWLLLAT